MATIGEATAPAQHTINYDALLSTTLFAYRKTLVDNIFKANAFLAALRQYEGVTSQNGGERVAIPLMYGENDTFKSYQGYETLVVKPQEGLTTAFYPWTEIAGTITISRREERQNSGESALLNLLKAKITQAEMSIKGLVNEQLIAGTETSNVFGPGNDAKDLLPLGWFLSKDNTANPTFGGNVGDIARATHSWWRHRTAVINSGTLDTGNAFALAVTTYAGMIVALKRMYNYTSRGADGSAANIILTTQQVFETYESAVDQRSRLMDAKLSEIGFDTVKMKGATMIWDELVPNVDEGYLTDHGSYATNNLQGTAFFLNTKFYKLVIDSASDFQTTPFVEPENQTAKSAKVLFMGQATCSNMSKQGVVYAGSHTIAA